MKKPKIAILYICVILLILYSNNTLSQEESLPSFNMTTFIKLNETIEFKGRYVTWLETAAAGQKNIFDVGGNKQIILAGGDSIDGMIIVVDEAFPDRLKISLNTSVNCGNTVCERNEDKRICCTDCGCDEDKAICIKNQCAKKLCEKDYDCTDNDSCTEDKCNKDAVCEHTKIEDCGRRDGCCLTSCTPDPDCDLDECKTDSDCTPENSCFTARCAGKPLMCNSTRIGDCNSTDKCFMTNESLENSYCTEIGWIQKKSPQENCTANFECLSGYCDGVRCMQPKSAYTALALFGAGILLLLAIVIFLKRKLKETAQIR